MLKVAGASREEVGDTLRWYTAAGTVDAGTREMGVPAIPGEGRNLAMWDPDLDILQIGRKSGAVWCAY